MMLELLMHPELEMKDEAMSIVMGSVKKGTVVGSLLLFLLEEATGDLSAYCFSLFRHHRALIFAVGLAHFHEKDENGKTLLDSWNYVDR